MVALCILVVGGQLADFFEEPGLGFRQAVDFFVEHPRRLKGWQGLEVKLYLRVKLVELCPKTILLPRKNPKRSFLIVRQAFFLHENSDAVCEPLEFGDKLFFALESW